VNEYREGKVKRTPGGEWNRTWNYASTISRSFNPLEAIPRGD